MPNQVSRCPECQVPIGGRGYVLEAGNQTLL
jgi:hypothetical protein